MSVQVNLANPTQTFDTSNDEIVNVRNSIVLADALAKKGIKFEEVFRNISI